MYTIGEFANLGHVTPRMLRHWDALGILRPAEVDTVNGYRRYAPAQLQDVLQFAELRTFGCSLDEGADVLRARDRSQAFIAALRTAQSRTRAAVDEHEAQLARLEARLSQLEGGSPMSDITITSIPAVTVYAKTGVVPDGENVPSVVDVLLPQLNEALDTAGVDYAYEGIFVYDAVPDSPDTRLTVSAIANGTPQAGSGYDVIELPSIERAATFNYRGDMAGIGAAWNAFEQAIIAAGHEPVGGCRELYLEAEPRPESEWLTQLQQPIR